MTQMKTLTVNGTTYAVTDDAAQKAIGSISQLYTPEKSDLTSAINSLIAAVCPEFTQSGDIVSCTPMAGTPLRIITHIPARDEGISSLSVNICGRNLYKPSYQGGTVRGVTCVNNGDGTYTLNGTATADASFDISMGSSFVPMFKDGMCLSGCPAGGSADTYFLCLPYVGYYEYGRGLSVPYNASHAKSWTSAVRITIKAGQTVENLVFKPQITAGRTLYPFEAYQGQQKSVTFDAPVYGGTYNWTTGVLTDENGQAHTYAPQIIVGMEGENFLYSRNCDIEVTGSSDVKAILQKLQEA